MTTVTKAITERCHRVVELVKGGHSVEKACCKAVVSKSTFYARISADRALRMQYRMARKVSVEIVEDELFAIATSSDVPRDRIRASEIYLRRFGHISDRQDSDQHNPIDDDPLESLKQAKTIEGVCVVSDSVRQGFLDECEQKGIAVTAELTELNEVYWKSVKEAVDLAKRNGIDLLELVRHEVDQKNKT